ncbi:tripartite tricarboxylate transporter substrate binding protein [Pseudoroseomonas cervicalis]|uniref:tripartite tricarboxylate transporter substrate binding protein n=1 Tax=Teichococcus cervicalis TaxID=204525 RepID=UPI0027D775AF|nr:tripartite tricarboxylate transporter substrate binding protein [Pseudoroseomonas cervicalis]
MDQPGERAPAAPGAGAPGRRRLLGAGAALAALALLAPRGRALAQQGAGWPERPLRLIVPVAPGGSLDPLARLLARHLQARLGQTVVVENHAGAGGNIAFELVARARPDGHTLLVGWDSLAINPAIYPRPGYDPLRDFAPILQTVSTAQLLVVRPGLAAATLEEFVALSRRSALTLGSPGNGSIGHLAAELLKSRTGAEWAHAPYRGGGPALQDLIAGHIDAVFLTLPAATGHVRDGRLRPLLVTTAARARALPAVPTAIESGLPGFEIVSWQGLLAPAGTDPAIIDRLNAEVTRLLGLAEIAAPLLEQGFEPSPGTPQALAARLAADVARWPEIVRLAGARLD